MKYGPRFCFYLKNMQLTVVPGWTVVGLIQLWCVYMVVFYLFIFFFTVIIIMCSCQRFEFTTEIMQILSTMLLSLNLFLSLSLSTPSLDSLPSLSFFFLFFSLTLSILPCSKNVIRQGSLAVCKDACNTIREHKLKISESMRQRRNESNNGEEN